MHRVKNRTFLSFPTLLLAFSFSILAGFVIWDTQKNLPVSQGSKQETNVQKTIESGTYTVAYVLDGDTVELSNGVRVRYAGIDAPEQAAKYGATATQLNKKLVAGHEVYLEISAENQDIYGRTLGFVWIGDNMVNEQLVAEGLARVYYYGDAKKPKYFDRFMKAQEQARQGRRGIWKERPAV